MGDYNQAIMEFGAVQCKPANPNCNECPLQNSCKAFALDKINELPVKLKKAKVSKKHFNFLVVISNDGKTILEQRTQKGIWQNLYQFPLVESNKSLTLNTLKKPLEATQLLNNTKYSVSLYNTKDVLHKLSHQHLYTKFWIVKANDFKAKTIAWNTIEKYPTPILIANFLKNFNPSNGYF